MKTSEEIKQVVKDKYNQVARDNVSCCDDGCDLSFVGEKYDTLDGYVAGADLGLGCGLPTEHADLHAGQTVVDLGSGAGNDCFIARSIVGETGRVIGIDMAEEMLSRANANLQASGFQNMEFRKGEIEDIPLADETADAVVSNCVFNLVPDKQRAFEETFRILKPGGHFSISDIVLKGEIDPELRSAAELYAGCVSGAVQEEEYLGLIKKAGFVNASIVKKREITLTNELLDQYLNEDQKRTYLNSDIGIYSITVNAQKPV